MNIEQIKEELTLLEGKLLQNAIDNTNGTYFEIKQYLFSIIDVANDKSDTLETSETLVSLCEEVLDTLEWEMKDFKPFK